MLLASPTWATNYYVSQTDGNDNYNGTEPTHTTGSAGPWQTIARVNARRFMPGDSILFKRGDTWRETLTVSSSGTTSNPITFGVYGSGLPPTVDGSDVVTSAGASSFEAHATLPNVWQKTLATEPRLVFFDGVKGQRKSHVASLISTGEWFWAAGVLCVYAASDPDTLYTSPGIEAGARDNGVFCANKAYVTIDGLHATHTNAHAILIGGVATGVTLQNSTLSWAAGSGLVLTVDSGNSNRIVNNTIHDVDADGITGYDKTSGSATRTVVEGNTLYNCHKFGMFLRTNYWDILHNTVRDSGNRDMECVGIELYSAGRGEQAAHNRVRYNTVFNIRGGFNDGSAFESDRWCDDNEFSYNVAYNCDGPGLTLYGATNATVLNNTFYGNSQNSAMQELCEIRLASTASEFTANAIVKNNLGVATKAGSFAIYLDATTATKAPVFSNNLWYSTSGNWYYNGAGGRDLATWNALSYAGRDLNAAPLFIDAAAQNFRLKPESTGIDRGIDVGQTKDILGAAIPQGSAPDIGAYEFRVPSVAPGAPTGVTVKNGRAV